MDINNQKKKSGLAGRQQRSMDGFIIPSPQRPAKTAQVSQIPAARASQKASRNLGVQYKVPSNIPADSTAVMVTAQKTAKRQKRVVRSKHPIRKMLLRGFLLILVVVLGTGGFLSWKGYSKLHKVFRGTTTVAALASKTVDPSLLKGEGDGRVNILLLGIGGAGHDGPDLTDTLLILSVDPVNNTAALLSIPRDLWVKMPVNYFGSYQKINAAYESGKYQYLGKLDPSSANAQAVEAGFSSIDTAMNQVLGININYHMLVDFQAFRQAIDSVGGVTVNVPDQLYDPTMAWENNWNPVLATAGVQNMNGVKALLYARSRETTSDFARTERQRQIMLALKDKVLTAGTLSNPAKIDGLMNAFGDNVYSDLSTQGASRLYSIMKQVDNSKIASIGLATPPNNFVTTDHVGDISVVRPTAGFNNYTAIQNFVHSQLVDGYIMKEKAPIAIFATSAKAATATQLELQSYGYTIASATTTTTTGASTTIVDLSGGSDKYTRHYLEDRYNVHAVTKLPAGVPMQPASVKFVILVSK